MNKSPKREILKNFDARMSTCFKTSAISVGYDGFRKFTKLCFGLSIILKVERL